MDAEMVMTEQIIVLSAIFSWVAWKCRKDIWDWCQCVVRPAAVVAMDDEMIDPWGETTKVRDDIEEWLNANCKRGWRLTYKANIEMLTSKGIRTHQQVPIPVAYQLQFADVNDAIMFRMTWF